MIQQLITVAGTLTGVVISYGLSKLYKKATKPKYKSPYEEIEITEYEDIWGDIY